MATHAEEDLRRAAALAGEAARALGSSPRARVARRRLASAMDGHLRHRHRHRGRQDGGRRGHRPLARRGRAGRSPSSSPRSPGSTSPARPTTSCCAAPPAPRRPTRRSPPTATGRPPRPTWRRRWPASGSSARCCSPRRAPRPRAPRCSSARGSAASWCRSPRDYLVRDLAVDLGLPLAIAAAPGPRHDQPHAADDRGGARGRPAGRGGRPHPLARLPEPRSRSPTARRSPSWASVRVETLPRLDLADPSGWPRPGRA